MGLPWVPTLSSLSVHHPHKCLTPERKMEVEELSPLAQRFPLTPTKGAPDEDDGFVDILESDLKVSSLAPSGPLHLPF